MMRLASVGPMRGRRSRDSAGAVSRSKGALRALGALGALRVDFERAERPERAFSRAASTAAVCRSSAARAAGGGGLSLPVARWKRTPAPRSATAEKKMRAWRSEGVTECRAVSRRLEGRRTESRTHHPLRAHGILRPRGYCSSFTATSPTICRLRSLTLSIVSNGVWCASNSMSMTSITRRPASSSGRWSSVMDSPTRGTKNRE